MTFDKEAIEAGACAMYQLEFPRSKWEEFEEVFKPIWRLRTQAALTAAFASMEERGKFP